MAKSNTGEVDKSYFYWRGSLAILLGVVVLVWPGLTLLSLVTLVSIWLLLSGVASIIDGIQNIKNGGLGWMLTVLLGVFELGVGAYLVQRPGLTALTIVTLLGAVFVVQGFVYFGRTFLAAGASGGQRLLSMLFAVLSFVAGVWLWRYPIHGSLAFVWLLGLYAIASGALLIGMGTTVED